MQARSCSNEIIVDAILTTVKTYLGVENLRNVIQSIKPNITSKNTGKVIIWVLKILGIHNMLFSSFNPTPRARILRK